MTIKNKHDLGLDPFVIKDIPGQAGKTWVGRLGKGYRRVLCGILTTFFKYEIISK